MAKITFGLYVDYVTRYPIRVTFNVNGGEGVVDYVNWVSGAPNATVFTEPKGCSNSVSLLNKLATVTSYLFLLLFYMLFFDDARNYNPSAPVNQTMPNVSNQFFMVLEGKLGIFYRIRMFQLM